MRRNVLLAFFGIPALSLSCLAQAPSMSAQQVTAKWRGAVHADNAKRTATLDAISMRDGVSGLVELASDRCAYREEVKRDFDDSVVVVPCGKEQASERDWNGWIREVKGMTFDRLRAELEETRTLLFGPGATMIFADGVKHVEGAYALVDGDRAKTKKRVAVWYIDQKTFLPLRSVRDGEDNATITSTYSDWTAQQGVLFPAKITVEETEKPSFTVNVKTLVYRDKLPSTTFDTPKAGPSDATLDESKAQFPFTMEANHIVLQASVNGSKPIGWILDTGADQNVINSARNADFGIKEYAKTTTHGGGNEADYGYAKDTSFEGAGWALHNQHVATIEQTGLERALGVPFGGILGYDWISRYVVEIDYEKKLITLHDRNRWIYKGSGYIVPVTFESGIPHTVVHVTVPTKPDIFAYMVMDFGAAETATFTSPFVQQNNLRELAGTNSTVNRPAGMEKQFFAQNNSRGRIERLAIGPLVVTSIPVNLSANTSGAYASTNFAGTIGESIDSRYHVYLDYQRSRIIFEHTPAADLPFPERQTFGMTILAGGADLHTFTITGVRKESPAEKAGFQKGDIVTAVDDKPSSKFVLSQLRDWLTHSGDKHTLTIQRGAETKSIPITVELVSIDQR